MPGEPRLAAVAACLCLLAARDAAGQMSRDTPKLRELQEQQAAADATWTPVYQRVTSRQHPRIAPYLSGLTLAAPRRSPAKGSARLPRSGARTTWALMPM